jgi:hypothetical protein
VSEPDTKRGDGLRLEWRAPWPHPRAWVADVGHLRLTVDGIAPHSAYTWEVGQRGAHAADFSGAGIVRGHSPTKLQAQVDCEAACLSLLTSSIAAFHDGSGPDACINWDVDGEPGMGTYDDYAKANPADARRLGISLLAAASSDPQDPTP